MPVHLCARLLLKILCGFPAYRWLWGALPAHQSHLDAIVPRLLATAVADESLHLLMSTPVAGSFVVVGILIGPVSILS